jgi:hypothetical protein
MPTAIFDLIDNRNHDSKLYKTYTRYKGSETNDDSGSKDGCITQYVDGDARVY